MEQVLNELKAFYTSLYQVLDGEFYSFASKYQVIWQHNNTRLLKFGPDCHGAPVLFIPSLINRAHILDVMQGNSFVEVMMKAGFPCYLVDWGDPIEDEASYRFEDYYTNKLSKILALLSKEHRSKVTLIGYCLGGIVSILAEVLSCMVDKLVLLACPWDFSCYRDKVMLFKPSIDYLLESQRLISSHFLRNFFLFFSPMEKFYKKFVDFASSTGQACELFLRVEKWSLSNMFIANGVLNELMQDFALQNVLLDNSWIIGGERIGLEKVKAKTFIISGETDAVVPYISTIPLTHHIQIKHTALLPTGHIGIVIGRQAKALQLQMIAWLKQ